MSNHMGLVQIGQADICFLQSCCHFSFSCFIVGANYVIQWRRYCDQLGHVGHVCGGMWVGVWVCTPDWNDLTLGTVVVLDTMLQPILGSKGQDEGYG